MHVFKMTNSVEHVVAESIEDAWEVWREWGGERREDYPDEEFELLSDDATVTITMVDDGGERVTRTCAEWVTENGRGQLAGES